MCYSCIVYVTKLQALFLFLSYPVQLAELNRALYFDYSTGGEATAQPLTLDLSDSRFTFEAPTGNHFFLC